MPRRRLYIGKSGAERKSNTAYKAAMWAMIDEVPVEINWKTIPVSINEELEPDKARYERLAALRIMYPKTFEKVKAEKRMELGLPPESMVESVAERRRAAGFDVTPRE